MMMEMGKEDQSFVIKYVLIKGWPQKESTMN
jgi:hypothetical protein